MGQRNSSPNKSLSISDRLICTDPDFVRFYAKNSELSEALFLWTRDEFHLDRYSIKKSDPEALTIEIEKKCRESLENEWVNFRFYPQKQESVYKNCILFSMVGLAKDNLKIHKYSQDLTGPSAPQSAKSKDMF